MSDAKAGIVGVFGRAADTYDDVEPRHFSHFGRLLVEHARLPPEAEVLDVAAGKGAVLFPAAKRAARVVGVDLAAPMVAALQREIDRRELSNAGAAVMDAEALEFEDESFDAVLCGCAIFMFPDPGRSLAEIRRVLRPGRTVGLSIFGDGDTRWDAVRDRLFANPPPQEERWTPPSLPFRNADDLRAGLEVSGFVDVRVQQEVFDATYVDGDQWLAWAWSTGYRGALERMTDEELEEFKAEVYPQMETAREGDDLLHNRLTAILGYGTKR
jgi:ubiquinone/menaquinone biosynthesis C-methylase UbiE